MCTEGDTVYFFFWFILILIYFSDGDISFYMLPWLWWIIRDFSPPGHSKLFSFYPPDKEKCLHIYHPDDDDESIFILSSWLWKNISQFIMQMLGKRAQEWYCTFIIYIVYTVQYFEYSYIAYLYLLMYNVYTVEWLKLYVL